MRARERGEEGRERGREEKGERERERQTDRERQTGRQTEARARAHTHTHTHTQVEEARQTLQTNRAAALLRLRSFPEVVSVCSEVLGKHRHCVKALARRAEGYVGLGNLVCDLHTIVVIYFDV